MKNDLNKFLVFAVTLMTVLSSTAYADHGDHDWKENGGRGEHGERHAESRRGYRMDRRYEHDRSYPREGLMVRRLPERRHPVRYHDRDYFYFGGVWYLPSSPGFVVVKPPRGIVVPILPSFYTTLWFDGVPYYYANNVYYVWRPTLNGYQVTAPPPAAKTQSEPDYMADQLFIYPKKGQSKQQQADDRYACHRWASDQTGYDPSQPPENTDVQTLNHEREGYNRAMKACLDGRGYSVR